jgi:hypothetical protein
MNGPLGGVNPSPDQLCVYVAHLIPPSPLSHDWCTVRTTNSLFSYSLILSSEQEFFSTRNRKSKLTLLWAVTLAISS